MWHWRHLLGPEVQATEGWQLAVSLGYEPKSSPDTGASANSSEKQLLELELELELERELELEWERELELELEAGVELPLEFYSRGLACAYTLRWSVQRTYGKNSMVLWQGAMS